MLTAAWTHLILQAVRIGQATALKITIHNIFSIVSVLFVLKFCVILQNFFIWKIEKKDTALLQFFLTEVKSWI